MKCSFCSKEVKKGRGLMYVKADGTIFYFDSGKCLKNMLHLKRKPGKQKWARAEKAKTS
ncbi:MAG: 50S ribosomal protein L24e [Candidatus Micrarchaeota archaeon]|nr:50S ribosomal protein L24e [Candidatus Micrarchaeota archaeon]